MRFFLKKLTQYTMIFPGCTVELDSSADPEPNSTDGSACDLPLDLRGKRITGNCTNRCGPERMRRKPAAIELRQSDADAHERMGSLKWSLDWWHENREAVGEEVRVIRRTAMNAFYL